MEEYGVELQRIEKRRKE